MDVADLKSRFTGFVFDEIELNVEAESLSEFAVSCGETYRPLASRLPVGPQLHDANSRNEVVTPRIPHRHAPLL